MRVLLVMLSVLCWVPSALAADVTIIYRKSDRVIFGTAHPPHSPQVELENVIRAEGQPASAFDLVTVDKGTLISNRRQGKQPTIQPNGTVKFEEPAKETQRKAAIQSGLGKLRGLGLTNAELDALLPGK